MSPTRIEHWGEGQNARLTAVTEMEKDYSVQRATKPQGDLKMRPSTDTS